MPGTVAATVGSTLGLNTVADDPDAAVFAYWSNRMNRTLEAIEGMGVTSGHRYFKRLVVVVTADFTLGHLRPPSIFFLPVSFVIYPSMLGTNSEVWVCC